MAKQVVPTKGNLMALKKSLKLAYSGYELMDKKRNILTREMMSLLDDVNKVKDEISKAYVNAYQAMQDANISMGISTDVMESVPVDNGISISYRSVMGVELVKINYTPQPINMYYGFAQTTSKVDYAYQCFARAKEMTTLLAEVENSVFALAKAINKSQKRANALKNIVIPNYEANIKYISEALDEKEREEFSRQKIIKHQKMMKEQVIK